MAWRRGCPFFATLYPCRLPNLLLRACPHSPILHGNRPRTYRPHRPHTRTHHGLCYFLLHALLHSRLGVWCPTLPPEHGVIRAMRVGPHYPGVRERHGSSGNMDTPHGVPATHSGHERHSTGTGSTQLVEHSTCERSRLIPALPRLLPHPPHRRTALTLPHPTLFNGTWDVTNTTPTYAIHNTSVPHMGTVVCDPRGAYLCHTATLYYYHTPADTTYAHPFHTVLHAFARYETTYFVLAAVTPRHLFPAVTRPFPALQHTHHWHTALTDPDPYSPPTVAHAAVGTGERHCLLRVNRQLPTATPKGGTGLW